MGPSDLPDLDHYLAGLRRQIDAALERTLAAIRAPDVLAPALGYSLLAGGKRLRPCLTLAVAEAVAPRVGLDAERARGMALPAAVAIEMIHTYSLIHDDLPAMDNDALRRGRPTTHVVYGDGMAILAGDGLLTEAFGVLASWPSASATSAPEPTLANRLRALAAIASAAGATGMVGGQAIDLAAAGLVSGGARQLDAGALEDMHLRKTGALIRAASTVGAILTGADEETIRAVDTFARELGLAFQIVDDILDVEGSNDALGKTAGKDAKAGKPTFPSIHGLETSKGMAKAAVARAEAASAHVGGRLAEIARWSLGRRQ